MKLSLVPATEPPALDGDRVDEALRAFVGAFGVVSARVLLDRAGAWLGVDRDDGRALLRDRLDALEDCGDVLEGPRGMLAVGPVLVVAMAGGRRLLVGGVSDAAIRASFTDVTIVPGAPRRLDGEVRSDAVAARFGGLCVDGARWAGFDDTPHADEALVAGLQQRAETVGAEGALETLDASAQRYLTAAARGGKRWRWSNAPDVSLPMIVRWTGLAGESRLGWAVSASKVLPLGRDEALRATWALERAAGSAPRVVLEPTDEAVAFVLDARLPRAEYRYIIHSGGECVGAAAGMRWTIPRGAWPEVAKVLEERLGIDTGSGTDA